ncbi:MAG: HK97 gp10 family phage protein [Thermoleophilia bacterium]|nr:HK97 gp10 family phage protein [Thermoleophilia bacterium]
MTRVLEIPVTLEVQGIDPSAFVWAMQIFREEFAEACQEIGLHVSERVKRIIIEEKIWYTGTLLNSITWSLIEQTSVSIGVAVGTNLEYAKYQEYGTVPHFVPFHLAKTLYDQAQSDWGWLPVTKGTRAYRQAEAQPTPGRGRTQSGLLTITTRRFGPKRTNKTYVVDKYPERLWLKPHPNARPVWGVVVSGNKQPFLWPGWEQSVAWVERRLLRACERAAERINGGG